MCKNTKWIDKLYILMLDVISWLQCSPVWYPRGRSFHPTRLWPTPCWSGRSWWNWPGRKFAFFVWLHIDIFVGLADLDEIDLGGSLHFLYDCILTYLLVWQILMGKVSTENSYHGFCSLMKPIDKDKDDGNRMKSIFYRIAMNSPLPPFPRKAANYHCHHCQNKII